MAHDRANQPVVLITGSTSGIGAASARKAARDGWRIIVTGRDENRGNAVVAEIQKDGGEALFLPSDLSASPDDVRHFARAAQEKVDGHIDALVHCAAVCPPVDTLSLTDSDLLQALTVNLQSPHVLTAELVPSMLAAGRGNIVMIASWMAHIGSPYVGLYSATKAAQIQLARSWAAEFGGRGVRVNTVSPGVTRAEASELDEISGGMVASTPAGRAGTPQEVAEAVSWLLSERSSYLYGAEIRVDGGITATRFDG